MAATKYENPGPTREETDATRGPLVLVFGTDWCGYCQGAEPNITGALAEYPNLPVRRVEDGPGRPLGRSFRVKLWPTLIALRDGQEVARVVRPTTTSEVAAALSEVGESQT